ncbi:MAG TPA: hypothetical protein VF403_05220, partial [Kofleriaceae bacterium]
MATPAEDRVTASLRGLVALAAITLALLIASMIGSRGAQRLDDHAVLANFDPARVQAITWSGAQPNAALGLARSGQGWKFTNDPTTPVIARSVEDVLSSLRSARWHRRADHARLGTVRRSVTLSLGQSQHTIDRGDALAGTDQTWIAVDHGDALLVDNWLVALLDPTALAFRDRTPLAAATSATSIVIHGVHELELSGPPWRVRGMLVVPALVDVLTSALAKLQLVSIELVASAPASPVSMTTIVIDKSPTVSIGGACPGGGTAVIAFSAKLACTDAGAADDVFHAVDALAGAPADVIDRRPAGFAFDTIELSDGTVTLGKRATVTIHGVAHPADPDRIAELVRALAEPGEPIERPVVKPAFTITVASIVLDVFAGAVQRRGEPLALMISPTARELLERPARMLVDAERWSEEPTTITTISLDGATYQRGVVLGEWSRTPAAKIDPALVDALAESVAKLHAPARTGPAATPHHLVVTFAPPIGS